SGGCGVQPTPGTRSPWARRRFAPRLCGRGPSSTFCRWLSCSSSSDSGCCSGCRLTVDGWRSDGNPQGRKAVIMMSRGARGGRAVHTSTTGRMPCSRGAASALAVIAILVSWLGGSELGAASELASLMEPAEIRVTFPQLDEVASPFAGAAKVNEAIHARALPLVTELAAIGSVWGGYGVHLERGSLKMGR